MTWKLLPDKKMNFLSFAQVLTPEECKDLSDSAFFSSGEEPTLNQSNEYKFCSWFLSPNKYADLYEKVTAAVLDSVVNNYGFKVQNISALYYVEFDDMDFMDWSMDLSYSDRETAKLSLHMPLNDDFSAGEFSIRAPHVIAVSPKPGVLTIFPSFLSSRQEPTSHGVKKAIVGTVTGLPFT